MNYAIVNECAVHTSGVLMVACTVFPLHLVVSIYLIVVGFTIDTNISVRPTHA